MDYEELVAMLKEFNENLIGELCADDILTCDDLCGTGDCIVVQAATAITDLLARAEAAEARAEKAERALAHMWYAYQNKDDDFPHEYEKEALSQAENILGKWEDVMQNMMKEE